MSRQPSVNFFVSVCKTVFLLFIICQLLSFFVIRVNCQTETPFTTDDSFALPSSNGSVRFASNGAFENAYVENNTWFFEGLNFSVDVYQAQKLNLSVSATDCDMTISPFFVLSRSSQEDEVTRIFFRYSVEGQGTQSVNLGFDLQQGQIEAILDGEWIELNHGWTRSPDGTVTVSAPVGNVTISFYGYPQSYLREPDLFEDHYVVLGSTFSLAVIVCLAVFVACNKRKGAVK